MTDSHPMSKQSIDSVLSGGDMGSVPALNLHGTTLNTLTADSTQLNTKRDEIHDNRADPKF